MEMEDGGEENERQETGRRSTIGDRLERMLDEVDLLMVHLEHFTTVLGMAWHGLGALA